VFEDVMKLYGHEKMTKEFPMNIKFQSEKALDQWGVTREMYSAFWEEAYATYFDGEGVVIPMIHAQIDMEAFSTLGAIISCQWFFTNPPGTSNSHWCSPGSYCKNTQGNFS